MKLYESQTWLRKRYLRDGKTVEEIAKEANCTTRTIYKKLKEYNLLKRR